VDLRLSSGADINSFALADVLRGWSCSTPKDLHKKCKTFLK
jgi:hypothetical protein